MNTVEIFSTIFSKKHQSFNYYRYYMLLSKYTTVPGAEGASDGVVGEGKSFILTLYLNIAT